MSLQVLQDRDNALLRRRELVCRFPSLAGHLTRTEAVKMVARVLKIPPLTIYPIVLRGQAGTRDVRGFFYLYQNPRDAVAQLPKHRRTPPVTETDIPKPIQPEPPPAPAAEEAKPERPKGPEKRAAPPRKAPAKPSGRKPTRRRTKSQAGAK